MRWLQWRLEADKEKNVLQALREMINKEETLAHDRAERSRSPCHLRISLEDFEGSFAAC